MRITDKFLQARCATINRALGHPENAGYSTPGVVHLSHAYGGTGVHRYVTTGGGVTDLMGYHGTKREASLFLGGMIEALRIAKEGAVESLR